MSGIVFLKTKMKAEIVEFYTKRIGMRVWLEQAHCIILKKGNLLLGFCDGEVPDLPGMFTFFYETKAEIDEKYLKLSDCAASKPAENVKYQIYHFFGKDPEGRNIEFQNFLNPMEPYIDGVELLLNRRSVRFFEKTEVSDELLEKIFEICRFSPTSMNCESFYFVVTRKRELAQKLVDLKPKGGTPIGRAPVVVAICIDPEKTRRITDDGHIASYHFMLAAKAYGLGTCWIGGMDRDDAKKILGIPQNHFISTITPLGFPAETPKIRERQPAKDLFKIL